MLSKSVFKRGDLTLKEKVNVTENAKVNKCNLIEFNWNSQKSLRHTKLNFQNYFRKKKKKRKIENDWKCNKNLNQK